jgi:hypothetical protein
LNTLKSMLKNFVSVLILLDAIALNPAHGTDSTQWEVPTGWTGGFFFTAMGSAQPSTSGGSEIGPGGTFALGYWLNDYNFRSGWEHEQMNDRNGASGSLNLIDTRTTFSGITFTSATSSGTPFTTPTTVSLACIPQLVIS